MYNIRDNNNIMLESRWSANDHIPWSKANLALHARLGLGLSLVCISHRSIAGVQIRVVRVRVRVIGGLVESVRLAEDTAHWSS